MFKFLKLTLQPSNCKQTLIKHKSIRYRSRIAEFYNGKSIFLTGGTGFLGQSIMAKLLRSSPDLDKLYVLLRPKKGEDVTERLNKLLKNPIFETLLTDNPKQLDKIVPISGDICKEKLGLQPEDEKQLKEKVSVVIHSAATVRFFEALPTSLEINLEGTRRVLELTHEMDNLQCFTHISTAFAQANKEVIEEKVYPAMADYKEVYKTIRNEKNNEKVYKKIVGDLLVTYTLSKNLAEDYVATHRRNVPTVIIRPSIVGAIYKDHLPGWLNNLVTLGNLYQVSRGLDFYALGNEDTIIDIIPVDYVTNLTLIAAAENSGKNQLKVYHSTSGSCNPVTWFHCYRSFIASSIKYENYVKYPSIDMISSKLVLELKTFVKQKLPAFVADAKLILTGKNPRYTKELNTILLRRKAYLNVSRRTWIFRNEKARTLFASLSEEDKEKFPCDPKDIDWNIYLNMCYDGIMKYISKR